MLRKYIGIFIFFLCLQHTNSIICYCISHDQGLTCSNSYTEPSYTTCDRTNCKPRYKSSQCYDCSGLGEGMYTIESNSCKKNICNGDVFIEKTNECTSLSASQNDYSFSDVYAHCFLTSSVCVFRYSLWI